MKKNIKARNIPKWLVTYYEITTSYSSHAFRIKPAKVTKESVYVIDGERLIKQNSPDKIFYKKNCIVAIFKYEYAHGPAPIHKRVIRANRL